MPRADSGGQDRPGTRLYFKPQAIWYTQADRKGAHRVADARSLVDDMRTTSGAAIAQTVRAWHR